VLLTQRERSESGASETRAHARRVASPLRRLLASVAVADILREMTFSYGSQDRPAPVGGGLMLLPQFGILADRRSRSIAALATISAIACCASCLGAPATDTARPSVVTPQAVAVASPSARERMPRPLPEPDLRSRFAPGLDVEVTVSRIGFVEAHTAPDASCTATLVLASGPSDVPEGLRHVGIADRTGRVAWAYEAPAGAGNGSHSVTCSRAGRQVTAVASFTAP